MHRKEAVTIRDYRNRKMRDIFCTGSLLLMERFLRTRVDPHLLSLTH